MEGERERNVTCFGFATINEGLKDSDFNDLKGQ